MYQHYYMNELKEHHPVTAGKKWKNNLCDSLLQYYDCTADYSDVCILIGEEKIHCHRLILSLNSNILKENYSQVWVMADENIQTGQNTSNYYQIKLLPDFDEHSDTVRQIVRSFYCGEINLSYENIKLVYKFAWCYEVQWLLKYAELMFIEILEVENFVDLFIFAQKFGTRDNKLIEYCISKIDSRFLKMLFDRKTGNIFELDYYCLKSITSSECCSISPIEIFNLISNWADFEIESRKCHIEVLLFDVKYRRIAKADLVDQVYPWILNVRGMEDSIRTSLMRKITERIRQADIRDNFLNSGDFGGDITEMRVDSLIGEIMQSMDNKGIQVGGGMTRTRSISAEELQCVVKARYPSADPIVKQCIIEYINDNKMINSNTITNFMKLYETNKDNDLKYLLKKFLNSETPKFAPTYVQWETLSFKTVQKFLKGVSLGEFEFVRVECIMRWADANSSEKDHIVKLLTERVCYEKIPVEYKKRVLKPYLKKILPNHVFELTCGVHEPDCMEHHEENFLRCTTQRISKEFYMMKDTVQKLEDCDRWLQLRITSKKLLQLKMKPVEFDLSLVEGDYTDPTEYHMNYGKFDYLLFDKKKPLECYPVHSDDSPNLAGLRKLFADYKDLYVLVMWIPDGSQVKSPYSPPIPPTLLH